MKLSFTYENDIKTLSDKNNWETVASRFSLPEMLKKVSAWKVMIPYEILSLLEVTKNYMGK